MKVNILDTQTGITHETGDDYDGYWWSQGNGSCDCNRRIMMGVPQVTGAGMKCEGHERFLIVMASDSQFSMAELNDGYPKELLRKHGVLK